MSRTAEHSQQNTFTLHGLTAPYRTHVSHLMRTPRSAIAGLRLWNTLPAELRQPDIKLVTFQRLLKTRLFKCDPGALLLLF